MKYIKNYNLEEELRKLYFSEISREDYEEYIEEEEEMGEECESESEFGFFTEDSYSIIKLGMSGESLAYYGNGVFLISYNGRYFLGGWNEILYDTKGDFSDEMFVDYDHFDDFISELKEQNIKHFFCGSF